MADDNRYNKFENTLQAINAKYISLTKDEMALNNEILHELLDQIIDGCKKNPLFHQLYSEPFYGGSFYDGLKINRPDEYDINIKLSIPFYHRVNPSNKNGYINLKLPQEPKPKDPSLYSNGDRRRRRPYYGKRGLHVLIDEDDYLNTHKVMLWMHQILSTWLGGNKMGKRRISEKGTSHGTFKVTLERRGPAFTFRAHCDEIFIKFDFVPGFEFSSNQWPLDGFRRNPYPNDENGFFIVPKPLEYGQYPTRYWRMSFQAQERKIIDSKNNLKPVLRLLKKLRDKMQHHEIKSYYIKTVLLWKAEQIMLKRREDFWTKPLSFVFMEVLKDYQRFIAHRIIPYFWYKKFNLIEGIDPDDLFDINMDLKYVIKNIETNPEDKFLVAKYLLSRRQLKDFMAEYGDS